MYGNNGNQNAGPGFAVAGYWAARGIRALYGKRQRRQATEQQEAYWRDFLRNLEMTTVELETIIHNLDPANEPKIRAMAIENGWSYESALVATYLFNVWPSGSHYYNWVRPEVLRYLAPHPRRFEVIQPGLTLEQAKVLAPFPPETEASQYVLEYVRRWLRDPRATGTLEAARTRAVNEVVPGPSGNQGLPGWPALVGRNV